MRQNITIVYAGAHDREPGSVGDASQEIGKGITGKSEKENLAAGVEVESLVQFVMLVLHAELQAMASLLPAQCVSSRVGLFDATVVGKWTGAQVEIVCYRDFRHARRTGC